MASDRIVRFYPPFSHYPFADSVRIIMVVAALIAGMLAMVVAWRRWNEGRRSAALYLVGLCLGMAVVVGDSLLTIGKSPSWWLITVRGMAVAFAYVASLLVPGEARRGVWARRVS